MRLSHLESTARRAAKELIERWLRVTEISVFLSTGITSQHTVITLKGESEDPISIHCSRIYTAGAKCAEGFENNLRELRRMGATLPGRFLKPGTLYVGMRSWSCNGFDECPEDAALKNERSDSVSQRALVVIPLISHTAVGDDCRAVRSESGFRSVCTSVCTTSTRTLHSSESLKLLILGGLVCGVPSLSSSHFLSGINEGVANLLGKTLFSRW